MQEEKKNYSRPSYTPLLVIEEAARCLLCYDAPCSKACPANTDPARFIRAVRFRNFKGAVEIVREKNALAGVCARVCPTEKLCKSACSRCGIDEPIEIDRIQEYITDYEEKTGMQVLKVEGKANGKVAIIGSGPAGLEAAATLRKLGYKVTVFEKNEKLGGYLTYGIPEHRLPNKVVDNEINKIKQIGVEFKTGIEVGKDISLNELEKEYNAVLVSTGLPYGRSLELFKDNQNVILAVDFLAKNKNEDLKINPDDVSLIIGGGDVAMDVASSLKLKGVKNVIVVARETWDEFLASEGELELSRKLNISIFDGYTPVKVEGKKVFFEHMKMKNASLVLEADKIYLAIGQAANPLKKLQSDRGYIVQNNYHTNREKVFATGDAIVGDKLVVNAVKLGYEAALEIHNFLGGDKNA